MQHQKAFCDFVQNLNWRCGSTAFSGNESISLRKLTSKQPNAMIKPKSILHEILTKAENIDVDFSLFGNSIRRQRKNAFPLSKTVEASNKMYSKYLGKYNFLSA